MTMATKYSAVEFSLLGGPLYRMGSRLGLVPDDNSVALGICIGLLLWVVLIALALIGGVGGNIFSLALIGAHVRLLVVIPLMFVSETVLNPRMAAFARGIERRGIVPEDQVPALHAIVARVSRWKRLMAPRRDLPAGHGIDGVRGHQSGYFRQYGGHLD